MKYIMVIEYKSGLMATSHYWTFADAVKEITRIYRDTILSVTITEYVD